MAVDQKSLRRYNATIERSLALFDANSDWADYIAFLSRLLKSLETGQPQGLSDIPSKAKIAVCLSRCLQHNLPSGVHQKALDVYTEIFTIIGSPGIGRDLHLYLPGLSHSLAFANLTTRPLILDLYENFLLRLPTTTLRPALKALILSLLPVIEEETSEDFERCLAVFNSLRISFENQNQEAFFWQTFFMASISNPQRRAGVLVYLARYLPKLSATVTNNGGVPSISTEALSTPIITPEPGVLVRCFATGLRDQNVLILRGFLDLLVTHLPLSTGVLQDAKYRKDLDILVAAALTVVLRRDMSLNRRLWTWFTGTESKSSNDQVISPSEATTSDAFPASDHFVTYGLAAVIRAIQSMLTNSPTPGPRTFPFRIVLSLMDRWEVGGPVVKASFSSMMRQLFTYQSSAPTQEAFDEVFRSANIFFDGIESSVVFDCLTDLVKEDSLDLVSFIVANFNLEQTDRVSNHVAKLGVMVADTALKDSGRRTSLISLLRELLAIVPQAGVSASETVSGDSTALLLDSVIPVFLTALNQEHTDVVVLNAVTCLEIALMLSTSLAPVTDPSFMDGFTDVILSNTDQSRKRFPITDACTRVLTVLLSRSDDVDQIARQRIFQPLPSIIHALWAFLDSRTPQYHVAVVEHTWRLHDLTSDVQIVESTILELLNRTLDNDKFEYSSTIERFGTFCHHSRSMKRTPDDTVPQMLWRPSLRVIDAINSEDKADPSVQWLLGLPSLESIFKIVLVVQNEEADNVLTLNRIQKIVRIMQSTRSHWRAFSDSSTIYEIYLFLLPLLSEQPTQIANLTHDAFEMLRMLYGDELGNSPPEELISLLIQKLDESLQNPSIQEEVLDTLLAVLNDKTMLPSSLVQLLLRGLSTVTADERLDKWITLLCNFLPNHAALLPSLLKITSSFCKRIDQAFEDLRSTFDNFKTSTISKSPERSIANLLSGLEYVLARSHQTVSQKSLPNSTPSNTTGTEATSNRSRANDRLTVTLCMQDAVKICAKLWSWRSTSKTEARSDIKTVSLDTKSFQYTSMKLRSRSRRILENLIEAESQECLETLISMWVNQEQPLILDLLQTLNGARPRSMLPVVFNAIYSRTNPTVLAPMQKSTLSVQLGHKDLMWFLNDYTAALEDDMLEEIWPDCAIFLREVLGNPMPHRQILIQLVHFCAVLSRKMENTNFTEESRMYKELADLCTRLFTAIFTIKPAGFDGPANSLVNGNNSSKTAMVPGRSEDNMLQTLVDTMPKLNPVLVQYDRLGTVYTGISANVTSPNLHSRAFPNNITNELLEVMQQLSVPAGTSKTWRKDMIDTFNNLRLFSSPPTLAVGGWFPLFKQLQLIEKTIWSDCLNRLAPPAAAGIMFGVGAAAARNEADRKTQLELRRIATLILASDQDACLPHLQLITQKIEDLFTATVESSPSLATRGDVYLVLRALLLKTTHSSISSYWPLLDAELSSLCNDMLQGAESKYTEFSKMQGAKLLDLLLLMRPDEFQLHEWLFITDTIDAIYPPVSVQSHAFADEVAAILSESGSILEPQILGPRNSRKPWLAGDETRNPDSIPGLLTGFFGQLSIRAFEDLYSLHPLDEEACQQDLVADLFSDVI